MTATSHYMLWMKAVVDRPLQRCINPAWMPDPDSWVWPIAEGHPPHQGWGRTWRDRPGLANLLWLIMGVDKPPAVWNARNSSQYCEMVQGSTGRHRALVDLAELNSIEQFVAKLEAQQLRKHEPFVDHLIQKAKRRLECVR